MLLHILNHAFSFVIHVVLNIYMGKDDKVEAVVTQKITADFILKIYDNYKKEKNVKKKKEMYEKLQLLSKNLNQYLVVPKDYDKYYN